MHWNAIQLSSSIQKRKLDHHRDADEIGAELADQARCGGSGTAGCENIVDQHDAIVSVHCVVVNFESVRSVFQHVFIPALGPRKFSGLPNRNKSGIEKAGNATAEDEAA